MNDAYWMGWSAFGGSWHLTVEVLATLSLIMGILVQARHQYCFGALHALMEEMFSDLKLTSPEQDVAGFILKGYWISEVAALRGSREGTIKAQLNAIYSKAGVENRGLLVSLLIEDLMRAPLIERQTATN